MALMNKKLGGNKIIIRPTMKACKFSKWQQPKPPVLLSCLQLLVIYTNSTNRNRQIELKTQILIDLCISGNQKPSHHWSWITQEEKTTMDVTLPPPLMISQGFLPTDSLLESLIQISDEVTTIDKIPITQSKNVSIMIRRIKLLSSLFEEIQESNTQLPPSSILCLTELYSVIRRVKSLIQACQQGSCLWNL